MIKLLIKLKLLYLKLFKWMFPKKEKHRTYLMVEAKKLDVPLFEIAVNPTVQLSDIKERRFIVVKGENVPLAGYRGVGEDKI